MTVRSPLSELLFAGTLALAVTALYWTSFGHGLLFDDERLRDGTVFGAYGGLWPWRPRLLSYGSFVWVQALLGEHWAAQRAVNVALHLATSLAVWWLLSMLLARTEFAAADAGKPQFAASRETALRIGVALFALNPVAVYAVAYLVQRPIVMAALFVALACGCLVRGLLAGRRAWFAAALACYALAVLSKEHAVSAALLVLPLYVFVRRPGLRRAVALAAGSALLLLLAAALLYLRFGAIVGTVFDETSRAYMTQLEQLSPGISGRAYLLSLLNQATRFFVYGFLWLVPDVTLMSIDVRPPFPLSLWGWPQTAGLLGYLAVLAGSAWLVARRSDALGLAALCVLLPALLFVTEFATVWVQDPFVLYRSYLWALTIPALVALPLVGIKSNVLAALGVVLAGVFAVLAFERLLSLSDARSAWSDAAAKVDLHASANAVGRWRPFLNLGAEYLERGNDATALRHFEQAEALGEPLGSARYSIGLTLQQMGSHERALAEFVGAEAKGFAEAALYLHRGESQYATGRYAEALASYGEALARPQGAEAERYTRLRRAEAAVATRRFDTAVDDYRQLLAAQPQEPRYLVGMAMARIGQQDLAEARAILDPLIERQPGAPAYFARAMALLLAGDAASARRDIEAAQRAEPRNPQYQALRERIDAVLAAERGKR